MKIFASWLELIRDLCRNIYTWLAIPSLVVVPLVVLIMRILRLRRSYDLFATFQAAHPELRYNHMELISLWRQTYGNLPYPNEFIGWYVAGAALVAFFVALIVVVVLDFVVIVLTDATSAISPPSTDKVSVTGRTT